MQRSIRVSREARSIMLVHLCLGLLVIIFGALQFFPSCRTQTWNSSQQFLVLIKLLDGVGFISSGKQFRERDVSKIEILLNEQHKTSNLISIFPLLIIFYLEEPSYNQALEFLFLICYLTTFLWKWGSNVNIELVVKIDFTRIIFVTSIYFHPVIAVWTSNEFYTLVFFSHLL